MTTLNEGRQIMLEACEYSSDPMFQRRMADQVLTITTGSNPFHVWERLPPNEKECFGSMEQHPEGMELCIEQWIETGAAKRWGEAYKQNS